MKGEENEGRENDRKSEIRMEPRIPRGIGRNNLEIRSPNTKLRQPTENKPLIIYLAVREKVVGSILVEEDNKRQQ